MIQRMNIWGCLFASTWGWARLLGSKRPCLFAWTPTRARPAQCLKHRGAKPRGNKIQFRFSRAQLISASSRAHFGCTGWPLPSRARRGNFPLLPTARVSPPFILRGAAHSSSSLLLTPSCSAASISAIISAWVIGDGGGGGGARSRASWLSPLLLPMPLPRPLSPRSAPSLVLPRPDLRFICKQIGTNH